MSKFPPEKTQASEQPESATAQALRQAYFDAFFAAANAGMLIFDRQLRYVQINEALAEMNGLTVADHIGRSVREVLPELAPTVEPMLQGILDTGKPILDCELMGETPKQPGIVRYWQGSYYPLVDANGMVFGLGGIVIEITDRKKTEDALKQSEERFRSLAEASAQIIWNASPEGELIGEQPSWTAFTGLTTDQSKNWGWLEIVHPDDRSYIATAWSNAVANRSVYEVELRMRRYEGEYRYISCRGVPILEPDGTIREWIGANTDITERKQAEDALRERNALLNSILESTPDIIVVKDLQGHYVAINSNVATFLGKSIEEIIGKDDLELMSPDTAREMMAKDRQIMATGITETYEEEISSHDETSTTFLTTKAPWRDANGNILGIVATTRDISDRKATERALQYNEQRFRSLTEATSQLIWTTNAEGELLTGHPLWQTFTGQSFEELQGLGWLDAVHPDDRSRATEAWFVADANKTICQVEYRLRHHSGEYRYMSMRAVPLLNADGSIREWFGVHTDITDRKQAEAALARSEERFRYLVEGATGLIWSSTLDGTLTYISPQFTEMSGYETAEFLGRSFAPLVHPQYLTSCYEFLEQVVKTGEKRNGFEFPYIRKDGSWFWANSNISPLKDTNCRVVGFQGIIEDISDRKQAEEALKQSEERYRSLILATSQIVWTGDAEGRCPDIPTLRAYSGQTVEEVVGFGWLDAMHPDDRERTAQVWMEAVQNKSLYDIEYRIRAADGNYRYFQGRAVPILNEDGSLREWVGTCTDIHDRKQAEFALSKAKEAAEAASRAKSEFLANMSHELRTPLNGIMGYAQILQRSKSLKEEERSRIDIIYQCGSHLLTLINDILDLSKIEAQKVELIPTDFHFPAFLQGVAEMCRIRAELKGIHFHFRSTSELPIGIRADEKRLRQVLINLLSNAIKFTDEGCVTFTVSFATEGKIRFETHDTGIGIPREQLQAIFEPFEQAGDRRRQTEGTGLGLAISQRIVELMGSTIEVQSEVNVGSIFWFDVNLPPADEWVKTSQTDDRGQIIGIKDRQPKILVIDDKWANRSVIANLLSPIGFEVSEAVDGQEGWQKIPEFQPDLVITDLLMPELDGFELIKRIRESETFKDIIIIVSSASVFETDRYRSIEAGGNDFLPKPIQATELLQNLQKYLHLEWLYEAHESPLLTEADTNEIIAPPATQIEMLYELAMKGNFREIIKQAALLEEIDSKYIPFAQKLYQMAKDFQDEEILTFIESYK